MPIHVAEASASEATRVKYEVERDTVEGIYHLPELFSFRRHSRHTHR
jgi:hypothetical protein